MRSTRYILVLMLSAALTLISTEPVIAHTGGITGGLFSGFFHPITGWDHVVAMVAVGLWGAFLGRPAIWILPVVFPLVMAIGGALGILGVPLPQVETGIAVSAIVLGLVVALAVRPPLWIAAVIVGIFAIFHGHAHGTELAWGCKSLCLCARLCGCNRLAACHRYPVRAAHTLAGWPGDGESRRCSYCAGRSRLPDWCRLSFPLRLIVLALICVCQPSAAWAHAPVPGLRDSMWVNSSRYDGCRTFGATGIQPAGWPASQGERCGGPSLWETLLAGAGNRRMDHFDANLRMPETTATKQASAESEIVRLGSRRLVWRTGRHSDIFDRTKLVEQVQKC